MVRTRGRRKNVTSLKRAGRLFLIGRCVLEHKFPARTEIAYCVYTGIFSCLDPRTNRIKKILDFLLFLLDKQIKKAYTNSRFQKGDKKNEDCY